MATYLRSPVSTSRRWLSSSRMSSRPGLQPPLSEEALSPNDGPRRVSSYPQAPAQRISIHYQHTHVPAMNANVRRSFRFSNHSVLSTLQRLKPRAVHLFQPQRPILSPPSIRTHLLSATGRELRSTLAVGTMTNYQGQNGINRFWQSSGNFAIPVDDGFGTKNSSSETGTRPSGFLSFKP